MSPTFLFAANTVLLAAASTFLCFKFVRAAALGELLSAGITNIREELRERRMKRLLKRYKRSMSVSLSLPEGIELHLIDKSNIRRFIPFMSFNTLITTCLALFGAAFEPVYRTLYFVPSAAVICLLVSLVPVFILDIMGRYNSELIRRRLAEFISVLNRWCAVKEDIFYAFERSVDSGLGEPLRTFVRDMVIQVNRGIEPAEALEMLQLKVDSPQFSDFIINIKHNIRYRGDIRKLLTNLENQYYKIEEEYNRRRISTYRDRLTIYLVMLGVLLTGYYFLKFNPDVKTFYLDTLQGKFLLTLFSLLYAGGFYLSFRITKFKH